MDLINRYVYAVIRSLPEKQRADIEKELRTLIDDMIEEYDEPVSYEKKVEKVLLELGDPEKLADNYRGSKRYLIGPQFYEKYMLILKIVLIAVFAGVTIATIAEGFFVKDKNVLDTVKDYLSALFSGVLQVFAWTTIAFMIAERNYMNTDKSKIEKDFMENNKWSLSQLPVIPEKKAVIPIHEPVISIIFSTIFFILLYTTPKIFSAYINFESELVVIPVFNQQVMQGFRIVFISILLLLVLKEVLKLYSRRWTLKLSLVVIAISAISTILTLSIFANADVWNPDFPVEIMKNMNLNFDFIDPWAKIKTGFIALIVVSSVIDIVTTLYKGIRYNALR